MSYTLRDKSDELDPFRGGAKWLRHPARAWAAASLLGRTHQLNTGHSCDGPRDH